VSLLQDQAYILDQILEIASAQKVSAIIVSGDIYDRSVPPATAVALLDSVVHKIIHDLKISLIMIPGNHDSAQRLGFASRQLKNAGLHILGELEQEPTSVVLSDAETTVAFWGMPYADPAQVRSAYQVNVSTHDQGIQVLTENIVKQFTPDQRNVVLSHCFLDGASESDSERPLSIGGADRVSWQHFDAFDYVALGHLHGRQFKGVERIRYSGSPLKYSFSEEKQIKSVTIVEITGDQPCAFEQVVLKPLRNMRSIEGKLETILQEGFADPNREDYLLVKLTDTHAILDVMGKLREVFPNILHLERPGLMAQRSDQGVAPQQLNTNELTMFEDFFGQIMQRDLTKDEKALVEQVIDNVQQGDHQ
jgi:exonuclease SbcD